MNVTVGYSFDNDSRIIRMRYSVGGSQLGNLTYGYDADGRLTGIGGTLAATGLPTSVSGDTFSADKRMTGFGDASASYAVKRESSLVPGHEHLIAATSLRSIC
jgi:hypothetical protein